MKEFEKFEMLTENIYKKLVKDPNVESVERNVQIKGKDGERQIDVLVSTKTVGIKVLTVIECKDYNRKVSVGVVDGLHSKMQDINAHKGIIVSRKGFSSQSVSKAKRLDISLYTAHETLSEKWKFPIEVPLMVKSVVLDEVVPMITFTALKSSKNLEQYELYLIMMNIIIKNLESKKIKLILNTEFQNIDLIGFLMSMEIEFGDNRVLVKKFSADIKLKIDHYYGLLNEVENTQLLKDISNGKSNYFINTDSLSKYIQGLKRVNNSSIPKGETESLTVTSYKILKIEDFNIEGFNIETLD